MPNLLLSGVQEVLRARNPRLVQARLPLWHSLGLSSCRGKDKGGSDTIEDWSSGRWTVTLRGLVFLFPLFVLSCQVLLIFVFGTVLSYLDAFPCLLIKSMIVQLGVPHQFCPSSMIQFGWLQCSPVSISMIADGNILVCKHRQIVRMSAMLLATEINYFFGSY